jgi:hypothetical protein
MMIRGSWHEGWRKWPLVDDGDVIAERRPGRTNFLRDAHGDALKQQLGRATIES